MTWTIKCIWLSHPLAAAVCQCVFLSADRTLVHRCLWSRHKAARLQHWKATREHSWSCWGITAVPLFVAESWVSFLRLLWQSTADGVASTAGSCCPRVLERWVLHSSAPLCLPTCPLPGLPTHWPQPKPTSQGAEVSDLWGSACRGECGNSQDFLSGDWWPRLLPYHGLLHASWPLFLCLRVLPSLKSKGSSWHPLTPSAFTLCTCRPWLYVAVTSKHTSIHRRILGFTYVLIVNL